MQSNSFAVFEAGPLSGWNHFQFQAPNGTNIPKGFLKNELGLTSMEVSLNWLPPGAGMPFTHQHRRNEELYVFLTGSGEFQIENDVYPIQPGTCVRCDRQVNRAWRCTGDEPLTFLCIQAPADGYGPKSTVEDGRRGTVPVAWTA
jgi:mannose-6-phosphate isomerase-like protein (cupin superfamily)